MPYFALIIMFHHVLIACYQDTVTSIMHEILDDKKSTSGLIFLYGSKPIKWNCCKQKVIALLSCEAEYISSTLVVYQEIWIS